MMMNSIFLYSECDSEGLYQEFAEGEDETWESIDDY